MTARIHLKSQSKYRAVRTMIDGIRLDSIKESKRYRELMILLGAGKIRKLVLQPSFKIVISGINICTYKADFQYVLVENGETMVEDVKGVRTAVYRLKKKLVWACHGILINEV